MTTVRKFKDLLTEIPYDKLEDAFCEEWQTHGKNFPAITIKTRCDSFVEQADRESEYILLTYPWKDPFASSVGLRVVWDIPMIIRKKYNIRHI